MSQSRDGGNDRPDRAREPKRRRVLSAPRTLDAREPRSSPCEFSRHAVITVSYIGDMSERSSSDRDARRVAGRKRRRAGRRPPCQVTTGRILPARRSIRAHVVQTGKATTRRPEAFVTFHGHRELHRGRLPRASGKATADVPSWLTGTYTSRLVRREPFNDPSVVRQRGSLLSNAVANAAGSRTEARVRHIRQARADADSTYSGLHGVATQQSLTRPRRALDATTKALPGKSVIADVRKLAVRDRYVNAGSVTVTERAADVEDPELSSGRPRAIRVEKRRSPASRTARRSRRSGSRAASVHDDRRTLDRPRRLS